MCCPPFVVINNARKQGNNPPEIEEKLLNLQRYHEKNTKTEDRSDRTIALQHNYSNMTGNRSESHSNSSRTRKRPTPRAEDDDDEWQLDTPKRSRPSKSTSSAAGGGVTTHLSPGGSSRERKLSNNETHGSAAASSPNKRRAGASSHQTQHQSPTATMIVTSSAEGKSDSPSTGRNRNAEKRKQQSSAGANCDSSGTTNSPQQHQQSPHQRQSKLQVCCSRFSASGLMMQTSVLLPSKEEGLARFASCEHSSHIEAIFAPTFFPFFCRRCPVVFFLSPQPCF